MISGIQGVLEAVGPEGVVVAVGGVSLRVQVPGSLLDSLGPVGSPVRLHTHLVVREDGLALYGFASPEALRLFELLLGVSGIGPKHALAVLSGASTEAIALAIATGDVETLSRIPGIGKKTASRLVLELKGKLEKEWELPVPAPAQETERDILAALMALGYTGSEAGRAMAQLPRDSSLALEERVRQALRYLGSRL